MDDPYPSCKEIVSLTSELKAQLSRLKIDKTKKRNKFIEDKFNDSIMLAIIAIQNIETLAGALNRKMIKRK